MGRGGARDVVGACEVGRAAAELEGVRSEAPRLRGSLHERAGSCDASREAHAAMDRLLEVATGSAPRASPSSRVGRSHRHVTTYRVDRRHHRGAGRVVHLDGSVPRAARFGFRVRALRRHHGDQRARRPGGVRCRAQGRRRRSRPAGGAGSRGRVRVHPRGARRVPVPGWCAVRVGDRAVLVPGYAPTAVNLYGAFHVVEEGTVVDAGPCLPATASRDRGDDPGRRPQRRPRRRGPRRRPVGRARRREPGSK